jgi:hypothetical protein
MLSVLLAGWQEEPGNSSNSHEPGLVTFSFDPHHHSGKQLVCSYGREHWHTAGALVDAMSTMCAQGIRNE